MRNLIRAGVISLFLQGCAILNPYDSESNCRMSENTGKCATVEEAYDASIKGEISTQPTTLDTESKKDAPILINSLGEYQDAYYKRLKSIIEEPVAPMVKPEQTIRALIMPYGKKKLYTARHVYVMVEEPSFVLGDYLAIPKSADDSSLINPIK